MSTVKRLEGKRDFLMRVIGFLNKDGWSYCKIIHILNISIEDRNYIDKEFIKWEEEQKEKRIGAAEVLEQIKVNNPKYYLESQKNNLAMVLGIPLEELRELEKVIKENKK